MFCTGQSSSYPHLQTPFGLEIDWTAAGLTPDSIYCSVVDVIGFGVHKGKIDYVYS